MDEVVAVDVTLTERPLPERAPEALLAELDGFGPKSDGEQLPDPDVREALLRLGYADAPGAGAAR